MGERSGNQLQGKCLHLQVALYHQRGALCLCQMKKTSMRTDDNAHQQDIEEDETHGEEYDSNDPLQLKLGDEIIKWTVLDDGVTVDQRSKDGFTWKQCAINWPSDLEVAEFRTALDCWNIMFPFQFFFGDFRRDTGTTTTTFRLPAPPQRPTIRPWRALDSDEDPTTVPGATATGRGSGNNTSPPLTPPSPHQRTLPPAAVPERWHRSPRAGMTASQPRPTPPTESTQPTPPPSPGPLPPPPRAPTTFTQGPYHLHPGSLARWPGYPSTLREWTKPSASRFTGSSPSHHLQYYNQMSLRPCGCKVSSSSIHCCSTVEILVGAVVINGMIRRREQKARSPPPAAEPPADPSQSADKQGQGRPNNRASGYARRAARAKVLQKLYQANPGACMRRLLDNTPPVYCSIGKQELVTHYTTVLAEPPPLDPPPTWLFPDRHPGDTGEAGATDEGDVLQSPVTPEEVNSQFKRTKRTAPGVDGIMYASWRWVDPQGLILSTIYNACRINTRIPRAWKHSTVTLIHKGGM
ncbi:hypothetical protein EMCRGX_G005521 [Ephydatia muelleri]